MSDLPRLYAAADPTLAHLRRASAAAAPQLPTPFELPDDAEIERLADLAREQQEDAS
jgi:hypothetical protein